MRCGLGNRQCVDKGAVLCHHSPGQIALTIRQDPLHSNGDLPLYMWHCLLQVIEIITSIIIIPPTCLLLPADICFHPSQDTCRPLHWLIHISLIYHVCMSKTSAQSCGSCHFRDKVEGETMKILSGDRCHLETIRVPHCI